MKCKFNYNKLVMVQPGDFSFIENTMLREVYSDAYNVVMQNPEFRSYIENKPSSQPWMFNECPIAQNIMSCCNKKCKHSGASLACTMRAMEYIIKNGWNAWYSVSAINSVSAIDSTS